MKSAQIVTATTTLVRTGPGKLHALTFNKLVATGITTVYDALTATGTPLITITRGAAILSDTPINAIYDIDFFTGLCIVTSQAEAITVSYDTVNP